jgi:methionyl-tRNA formyltransferase
MGSGVDRSLTAFVMTAKAVPTLAGLEMGCPGLVRRVVYAVDPAVRDESGDAVLRWCREHDVQCIERTSFSAEQCDTRYAIAVGWRWMLSPPGTTTLIVFHDSLLPKYRGFNPLVTALINGDHSIGVTAILGSDEYDRGDIIDSESVAITRPMKIANAIELVSGAYTKLATRIAGVIASDSGLPRTKQDESQATYSLWRDDADYVIDWTWDAHRIRDFVHAVGEPYAGARTSVAGEAVTILDVEIEDDVRVINRDPGKVVFLRDGFPTVVCGSGLLRITCAEYEASDGRLFLPMKSFRVRFGA